MGVSGFYRWITQRYPLIRHRTNDLSHPRINNFYIDFNCIVYNSIRLVKPSQSGDNSLLFNEVCRYLDLLVQTIKPETLLYIAVDGPAPLAKCSQQRTRRFVAARDHVDGTFSTANISVGTEFMEKMHLYLLEFIQNRTKTDPTWELPKVIYSSYKTPGEGEHKFFAYIREQQLLPDFDKLATHCVFSPDADLIFLTLQTGFTNFYIMREWSSWMGPYENVGNGEIDKMRVSANDFELLHLPILVDYFKLEYGKSVDIHRLIIDFIAISFLIGNDFIPHFPEISIQSGDFDSVLRAYRVSLMDNHVYLVEPNHTFNKTALNTFLQAVVNNIVKSCKNGGQNQEHGNLFTIDGARKYLRMKYKDKYNGEFEKELCFAVIDSFNWVLKYYLQGCPSWTWQFQYLYAPPLILVAQFTDHESEFDLDRPPFPLEQLLCILPPKMQSLLPQSVGALMFHPSPIAHIYPSKFELDLNGRRQEHEGVVLIPFVEIGLVRNEFAKIADLLTDEEKLRNTLVDAFIIKDTTITKPLSSPQPGLPTLALSFPYTMTLESYGLNIFARSSQYPSYYIKPTYSKKPLKPASEYAHLIGKLVLVDWPFLRPAVVQSVFDRDVIISKKKDGIIESKKQKDQFEKMAKVFRVYRGIDTNDSQVGIIAKPYAPSSIDGSVSTSFDHLFPLELVDTNTVPLMERYGIPEMPKYKVGDRIVLSSKTHSGRNAIVKEISDSTVKVELINMHIIDTSFVKVDYPLTIKSISDEIGIEEKIVEALLSTISVSGAKDLDSPDVGLTLFFEQRVLDGISTFEKNNLMFVPDVLQIIRLYLKESELEQFFKSATLTQKGKLVCTSKTFGAKPPEQEARITALMNWIKYSSPISGLFLIPKSIKMVSRSVTKILELRLNQSNYKEMQGDMIEVSPDDIVYPGKHIAKCVVEIGQRVTSIVSNGPVPFGITGTVVGYDYATHEVYVVADHPFKLGSNLRNRIQSSQGYTAKVCDVILLK